MKNYEDLLLERIQVLTGKLAQKQREGCLTEELSLCSRLAQLHGQSGSSQVAVQFWQSCMQIATDLGEVDEILRAAAEIAKIYCKEGQIDEAEDFMKEHLKIAESSNDSESLRLSLLKAEVITAMAPKDREMSVKEFLTYERALKTLDSAFESTTNANIWWWEAVAFRAELLTKLAKFDETRFKEAIDVVNAIQSGTDSSDVLMSLRCKSILSKIYFDMREYSTALEAAISAIDQYKSDTENSNYRLRRRIYCEMLFLAGRTLRYQKDFNFALQNLLLAKDEAQALAVERELMEEISVVTQESINAQAAADEVALLQRKKNPTPKDLEELADKLGMIGDFEGQLDLLEKCRAVAITESTQKRLHKKLINLNFYELRNWQAVLRIESYDWRSLILKGRAYTNLCKFEKAEELLLEALKLSNENFTAQAALFFYYRQRGKMTQAEKYEVEALSLETIFELNAKTAKRTCLIDPKFSYFATRKPSNSLMKMIGSGMMMKTKTKKTKGLQLKRRRGPSRLHASTAKVRRVKKEEDEDSGLSDFIVSDDEDISEQDKIASESDTKKLELSRSLIVITSSDESEPETLKMSSSKPVAVSEYGYDSPLMIRTETLDKSVVIDSPLKINFDESETESEAESVAFDHHGSNKENNCRNDISRHTNRVVVRFKKGFEVLIPTSTDVTVKELIKTAQTRFYHLFPEEAKSLGQIFGLSFANSSAMFFPDDRLDSILSGDSETLQAHFKQKPSIPKNPSQLGFEIGVSPSKLNTIEEDFRRKIQVLNLKADGNAEIKFLKSFQDRFKNNGVLDLSALSLDSIKFSEYSSFINKFLKLSDNFQLLNLKENLLVDEDLRSLTSFSCEEINLSANFLQKPNMKAFLNCDFIDFSYNPINVSWLINQSNNFYGLNLIGCFELQETTFEQELWDELGKTLSNLKKLKLSFIPKKRFFSNLCSGNLEEIEFFAVDWQDDVLVELSYLERLKSLTFTCCTFNRIALEALGKVLKRTCSLENLNFNEIDFEDDQWFIIENGIKNNFSLKQIKQDDQLVCI